MKKQIFNQTILFMVAMFLTIVAYGQLQVTTTSPGNNTSNVGRDANIVLDFNTPVDGATVNANNIVVRGDQTGIVPGTFSGGGTTTITFDPTTNFLPQEKITVTLTTTLMNTSAQPLTADYTVSFTSSMLETKYLQTSRIHDLFTMSYPRCVAAADFDGDGDMDMIHASDGGTIGGYLLTNDGSQNFTTDAVLPTYYWVEELHPADLDSDGDLDVVISANSALVWLENDGAMNFTLDTILYSLGTLYSQVGDMDGDGDMDIVAGVYNGGANELIWLENDGNQNFSSNTIAAVSNFKKGRIRDMDQDGDLDIVWVTDNSIKWYENNGSQVFTDHIIDGAPYSDLDAADLDGDGDIDVVASSSNNLSWFENDGANNFTNHLITGTTGSGGMYLQIADLDGDQLKDFVVGGITHTTWYRANRMQNFTPYVLTTGTIGTSFDAADMDGDGDLDLAMNRESPGYLGWIEMDTMVLSSVPAANANNVPVTSSIVLNFEDDINGTSVNDVNIAVRGEWSGKIAGTFSGGGTSTITFAPTVDFRPGERIFVSVGDQLLRTDGRPLFGQHNFTFRTAAMPYGFTPTVYNKHLVSDSLDGLRSIFPSDIDGDGDIDVLGPDLTDNKLVWFENDGNQNYTEILVDASISANEVYAVDLDDDGDMDLMCSDIGSLFFWYENDGSENFTRIQMPSIPSGYGSGMINGYQASDMDGDNDLDVVVVTISNQNAFWYENDGNENFTLHLTHANVGYTTMINADVDGDGDIDAVSYYNANNELTWFDNDEEGNMVKVVIDTLTNGVHALAANDIDGDGDMDLIVQHFQESMWYENQGNQGFIKHTFYSGFSYWGELDAMDLDADSDIDILMSSGDSDSIAWFKNDGSQNFTREVLYVGNYTTDVYAIDMDNDGDMDVLATSYGDNEAFWLEFSCNLADVPVVTGPSPICPGVDATLTWTGNLNDATQWYIHADSCTGPIVDSTTSNTIDLNPLVTTTYFIEGGGACGGAGCGSVTVTVYPEYNIFETVAVHSGDVVTFPDATTQTIVSDSVIHYSYLTTVNGCDSIIQTTVLLTPDTPPNGTCDGALDFDGVNDRVGMGGWYHYANSFTVEFWANIPSTSNAWDHIVENGSVEYNYRGAYRMQVGNEGEVYCAVGNGSTYNDGGYGSGYNLGWEYGEWNHYALTYDGDTVRVFLNGVERISYTTGGLNIMQGDGTLLFSSWKGVDRFYNGMLDEVRIWDAARNSTQIVSTMSTQLAGTEPGLLGYWDFNDGYGTQLTDISTFPNHGMLVDMDPLNDWVTVNGDQINSSQSVTICDNDSLVVGNNTHYTTGIYTDTVTNGQGCDSVVVTDLTVLPTYNTALTDITICSGDSALIFSNYETLTGTYADTLTALNGCDSVITQTLNVIPAFNETATATICDGDSYTFGNQTLTTTGNYTEVFTAANGCDSTVNLTFNVNPLYNETTTASICDGNSYTFGTQTLTTAGNYTEVFTSMSGCDSTVTLTLNVNPLYNETATVTICDGDSYIFGTQTLTTAGNYTEVFTSMGGCDSTVTLTLNVNPTYNETTTAEICQYSNYVFGTQTLTTSGTYIEVFQSVNGCDSTVTLTLTVHPAQYITLPAVTICDGETITHGTQTITSAGNYAEIFQSSTGCDSIVNLIVLVNPVFNETSTMTICDGDSYTFGTQTLTTAGSYTEVFTAVNGCDSTVNLTLNVNPEFIETASATICDGDSYTFGTQTLTTAGNYTEVFQSVNGCDSTVTLTLTVNTVNTGISVSGITLTADAAGATYQWVDCDNNNDPIVGESNQDFTPTANGSYAVEITENGCTETSACENITTIGITENELNMSLLIYPNPNSGKFYIEPQGSMIGLYTIELFNSLGQIVYTNEIQMNDTHLIELSNTVPGMYTVRVGNEQTETRQRIIVK